MESNIPISPNITKIPTDSMTIRAALKKISDNKKTNENKIGRHIERNKRTIREGAIVKTLIKPKNKIKTRKESTMSRQIDLPPTQIISPNSTVSNQIDDSQDMDDKPINKADMNNLLTNQAILISNTLADLLKQVINNGNNKAPDSHITNNDQIVKDPNQDQEPMIQHDTALNTNNIDNQFPSNNDDYYSTQSQVESNFYQQLDNKVNLKSTPTLPNIDDEEEDSHPVYPFSQITQSLLTEIENDNDIMESQLMVSQPIADEPIYDIYYNRMKKQINEQQIINQFNTTKIEAMELKIKNDSITNNDKIEELTKMISKINENCNENHAKKQNDFPNLNKDSINNNQNTGTYANMLKRPKATQILINKEINAITPNEDQTTYNEYVQYAPAYTNNGFKETRKALTESTKIKAKESNIKFIENATKKFNHMEDDEITEEEEYMRKQTMINKIKTCIGFQGITNEYWENIEKMLNNQGALKKTLTKSESDAIVLRSIVTYLLKFDVLLSDEEYNSLKIIKMQRVISQHKTDTSTIYITTETRKDIGLIRSKSTNLKKSPRKISFCELVPIEAWERYSYITGTANLMRKKNDVKTKIMMGNKDYLLYVRENNDNRKWKELAPVIIDDATPQFKLGKVINPKPKNQNNRKYEYLQFQIKPQEQQQVIDITTKLNKLPIRKEIPDQWDQTEDMETIITSEQ